MRWAIMLCVAMAGGALADEPAKVAGEVSYWREVRPIFQAQCQGCHQPAKPLGKFVMTDFDLLLQAGESGQPSITPGKPEMSYLVEQITAHGEEKPAMPKGRTPLSAVEVGLIERWIRQGAKNDSPAVEGPAIDEAHPPVYQLPPIITSLDVSPDGKLLAVSGYHEVLLHTATPEGVTLPAGETTQGTKPTARLVGLSERIESIRFSPDGTRLAVVGGSPGRFGEVQIWDVASRKLQLSLSVTFDTLYGASWSGDGTRLAFGCGDNSVRAIDTTTGQQVLFQGAHSDWALGTVWSKDATHLVSISRDRSMKLTEVATQRFVDNITSITPGALKGGLMALDRHPTKDELLIGGSDGLPKIYKMFRTQARSIGDDFNLIRKLGELPGRVFCVRYSRDGKLVAAGSSFQTTGQANVFQEADGKQLSQLEGQQGGVFTACFSPDARWLATGGFDGQVRINDPQTGKLLQSFIPFPLAKP